MGLLHLGQTEFDLTFELIKKSLKGKQASYLVGLEKDELKSAELLSAVIVYANEILYYVDLRNGEIMQLIDDAADRLVKDIVLLERGGYMAADEAQLDLIATITNKNRHKKLEFTEVDRETIGSRGEELLSLVCCEQKLNVERILLPSDDQVTDTLEYHNDGYKMMQQLDQQFNRFDLQDRSKKRRLSDEGENRFHHDFGFFVEEKKFLTPLLKIRKIMTIVLERGSVKPLLRTKSLCITYFHRQWKSNGKRCFHIVQTSG